MIRSNSSGGVTAPAPASPRALRSFHSPAKPRPRLAELEFPPPPPDLPPPPEDPQPPPPPPPPDCCRDAATDTDEKPARQTMKEMLELKLVAEIKERADKKQRQKDSPPPHELLEMQTSFGDPVTRLVSELSESLNLEALRRDKRAEPVRPVDNGKDTVSPIDLKASLRKTPYNNVDKKDESKGTDFKSQLKKVDTKRVNKDDEACSIIDFKARLRKVDSGTNGTAKNQASPEAREERKRSESSLEAAGGDEEDKRRSTGSISSLKKLWENKDTEERLSPKMKPKGGDDSSETSPEERRRARDERPAVPSKPAVRHKPKGGIYATPLAAPAPDEDDVLASLRASLDWCTNEVRRGCGGGGGRGSLWRLQTSERLARLGSACANAAGSPRCGPHLRVQLRAAAARLEGEARALASPAPPRHHLADGVEQALKELAHIVNR